MRASAAFRQLLRAVVGGAVFVLVAGRMAADLLRIDLPIPGLPIITVIVAVAALVVFSWPSSRHDDTPSPDTGE